MLGTLGVGSVSLCSLVGKIESQKRCDACWVSRVWAVYLCPIWLVCSEILKPTAACHVIGGATGGR